MTKAIAGLIKPDEKIKILDCGIGAGNIGKAIKAAFPTFIADKSIILDGCEVFSKYIDDQRLAHEIGLDLSAYNKVSKGDPEGNFAHLLEKARKEDYDIIIFGDSLEHVHYPWAEHSLYHALRVANLAVIVNMPSVEMPQDPVYGNEWERHNCFISPDLMASWGAEKLADNGSVACYIFKKSEYEAKAVRRLKKHKEPNNG
jgi:hypothetical protein